MQISKPIDLPVSKPVDKHHARKVLEFDGNNTFVGAPELSVVGDFELSVDLKTTQLLTDFAISDSNFFQTGVEGNSLIYVDNPDGLQLIVGNGTGGFQRIVFGGQALISNGEKNNIRLVRGSDKISAFLNNTQLGTVQSIISPVVIFEGLWFGGSGKYLSGCGSDLKIWTGGDSTTGTKVLDLALDDESNVLRNSVNGLQAATLHNATDDQWSTQYV